MSSRSTGWRSDGGFTLIELMIVILVLGVLVGLAIFNHRMFAERASETCAAANNRIELTVENARVDLNMTDDEIYDRLPGDCSTHPFSGGSSDRSQFMAGPAKGGIS